MRHRLDGNWIRMLVAAAAAAEVAAIGAEVKATAAEVTATAAKASAGDASELGPGNLL